MTTKIRDLRRRADSIWYHKQVRDPRGGLRTVEVASKLHEELQKRIDREISEGHDHHTRLPRFARIFSTIAVFIDFFILLYFMTTVFNVDFNDPWGIQLAISAVFAILATGISYAVFTSCGTRLRDRKTTRNTIRIKDLDLVTWLILAGTILLILVTAVLMFLRVSFEVLEVLGLQATRDANIYAVVFSVMVIGLACVVIFVHAFDGSILTERVEGLAKAIKKPVAKRHKMLDQAQELEHLVKEQQEIAARYNR